jgi:hypothetical protein
MALSLEELTAAALEGAVGPVTLAVGASALALALAAGTTRPLRRIAASSAVAVERAGQLSLTGWLGTVKRGWRDLVAEARAEYEADRPAANSGASPIVVASASTVVPGEGTVVVVPSIRESETASRTRDRRGRFVRRATNGAQPE